MSQNKKKLTPAFIFWLVLAKISILVIDQFLKYISVSQQRDFFVFAKRAGFVFNINPDAAFNLRISSIWFCVAVLFFFGLMVWQYVRAWQLKERLTIWLFGLIIVGATSNIIDRFIYGYVIDYLYFAPLSYINLADIAIFAGAGIFLIFSVYARIFKQKQ